MSDRPLAYQLHLTGEPPLPG